jgi:hypothetical protein
VSGGDGESTITGTDALQGLPSVSLTLEQRRIDVVANQGEMSIDYEPHESLFCNGALECDPVCDVDCVILADQIRSLISLAFECTHLTQVLRYVFEQSNEGRLAAGLLQQLMAGLVKSFVVLPIECFMKASEREVGLEQVIVMRGAVGTQERDQTGKGTVDSAGGHTFPHRYSLGENSEGILCHERTRRQSLFYP